MLVKLCYDHGGGINFSLPRVVENNDHDSCKKVVEREIDYTIKMKDSTGRKYLAPVWN